MYQKQNRWKKQMQWIVNFKPSISLHVSLNYLRYFLINGILFFFIIGFLYMHIEMKPARELMEQLTVLLEYDETQFEEFIMENPNKQLTVVWKTKNNTPFVLYSGSEEPLQQYHYMFGIYYLGKQNEEWKFCIQNKQEIYPKMEDSEKEENYQIWFYYDFSNSFFQCLTFLGNAGIIYLALMLFILAESRRDNKRIFQPIYDLTETAKHLTVANLHSERLPVQNTQKELRELTLVFNEMLDRLERSYESQKQFVSNASHELRTPIAVIQGYARMLSRWGSSDREILQEAVEAIGEESKAMQELVEKLLFLSRHDRKTLKVEKEWFSMGKVVEDMVKETRMVTKDRQIKVHLIQNVSVYGDDQLLKQAVRVFIDNAIKYSKEGDSITIGCENYNGNCVLTIEDTGCGMKKEDVDHMFERFYRSNDVRGKVEGHGLGLSIARLIILAHAGTIKIRTQYTVGTSFTILLPRQRMAPRKPQEKD